jgi:prevent-host-death family protein
VSENEIGLREARAQLGELVNQAEYAGQTTYITRHGRRVAAIVPINVIPQEPPMSSDLTTAVRRSIEGHEEGIDVAAIVEEIGAKYGYDIANIDEIDGDEYWAIVRRHDSTQVSTDVIVYVMRGESPGARAVEFGPLSIDIPDEVLAWAEANGLDEDDTDTYLLVAPDDEQPPSAGVVASREAVLPAADVAAISAAIEQE